ncbi:hypothetical protein F0562_007517 [Nyssa sinensis]|uniref:Xylanase inhibitor C-terminal domain-containing protein n=1 Tax=Nyssa sinensis TaxID=561372 RepID=A0A5J5A6M3_9ASTE|nr:hypothetical protein F0562_007517 [Nyssa sinensis]
MISGSKFGPQKLQVRYRYRPCSPIGTGKKFSDSTQILYRDSLRVHSINNKTSYLDDTKDSKLRTSGPYTGGAEYFVTIGFGMRKLEQTVLIDTGTIIDSGTVITCLPQSAYKALQSEFQQWMSKYPPAPQKEILNTCYNLTGNETVVYPNVVFNLGGGIDENLDQSGIVLVDSPDQVCLAFAAKENTNEWNVIGNHQPMFFMTLKGEGWDLELKVATSDCKPMKSSLHVQH